MVDRKNDFLYYLGRISQKWSTRYIHESFSAPSRKYIELVMADQHLTPMHPGEKSESYEPWLPYDVIVCISQYLHQVDLVNLSMTCKRVRNAMGIVHESNVRLTAKFSNFTCGGQNRRPCWGCGAQTCSQCQYWSTLLTTEPASHAASCRPSCHACMRKRYASLRTPSNKKNHCNCHSMAGSCKIVWKNEVPTPQVLQALQAMGTKFVCRNCYLIPLHQLRARREIQDKQVREQLRQQPIVCQGCFKILSKRGARFWQCMACRFECNSSLHPAWSDRRPKPKKKEEEEEEEEEELTALQRSVGAAKSV